MMSFNVLFNCAWFSKTFAADQSGPSFMRKILMS